MPDKVCLWAVPRSLSTAFVRAMENGNCETKVFFEPYTKAYYFSDDAVNTRYINSYGTNHKAFLDVKHEMEEAGNEADTDVVFVKELAYTLFGCPHSVKELLPEGYKHSFLIRSPDKTIKSMYKMAKKESSFLKNGFYEKKEIGFKELQELVEVVEELTGSCPPIVDADALLSDPEATLKLYCSSVGLQFQPSMVNWNPEKASVISQEVEGSGWFEAALNSHTFQKPSSTTSTSNDNSALPDFIKTLIEENMPIYKRLLSKKLIA